MTLEQLDQYMRDNQLCVNDALISIKNKKELSYKNWQERWKIKNKIRHYQRELNKIK